jgi:hypothetical protein
MNQNRNSSIARSQNKYLNEEFFDIHPQPYEVDIIEITDFLRIYIDVNNPETFLIEHKFKHWEIAKHKTAVFQYKFKNVDVDVYRIGKSLFLRRLLF